MYFTERRRASRAGRSKAASTCSPATTSGTISLRPSLAIASAVPLSRRAAGRRRTTAPRFEVRLLSSTRALRAAVGSPMIPRTIVSSSAPSSRGRAYRDGRSEAPRPACGRRHHDRDRAPVPCRDRLLDRRHGSRWGVACPAEPGTSTSGARGRRRPVRAAWSRRWGRRSRPRGCWARRRSGGCKSSWRPPGAGGGSEQIGASGQSSSSGRRWRPRSEGIRSRLAPARPGELGHRAAAGGSPN